MQLFDRAHHFLTENLQRTLLLKKLEEITRAPDMQAPYFGWMIRIGHALSTPTGDPMPTLDKEDARTAERELSQFRDGAHPMMDRLQRHDPAAITYRENLLRRSTGGK